MLDKLRQAAILTFLLHLLMVLSSPTGDRPAPLSHHSELPLPILSLQTKNLK